MFHLSFGFQLSLLQERVELVNLKNQLKNREKLDSFIMLESRNKCFDTTLKIDLRDQEPQEAISFLKIHIWIGYNLRTVRHINAITGNTNQDLRLKLKISNFLFHTNVRSEENSNRDGFDIAFYPGEKDAIFPFEEIRPGNDSDVQSWERVLQSLLSCNKFHENINLQDVGTIADCRDFKDQTSEMETQVIYVEKLVEEFISTGQLKLANEWKQHAKASRKKIDNDKKKNSFKLIELRHKEIRNQIIFDLHGLHTDEALWFVKLHLFLFYNLRTVKVIYVITGHGESRANVSVLKEKVGKLLKKIGIQPLLSNKGQYEIQLPEEQKDFNCLLDNSDCN
ncbi:unnamed protein product [Lactuca saligna]|uniref:Smr domain-containing protein n=1 Tax=Lactuca saligna TaxID=75948 RepID=A0AA35VBQ5_LACSI|nr:unnamed protein product [Lactuca saligna]